MEAIKRTPLLKEHIKYFIIDDGWQSGSGYWEANEKFPMGMKEIADKIKEAGLIPGIWSAPFIVTDNDGNTELIKDHPDWFLRDRDGNMVPTSPRNPTYILDITHPEVKTYVSNIYKKFNDWGYRYYKTDFLKEATLPMIHGNMEFIDGLQRYDRTVTPEEAMNEINKIIRDAIGENSFWMGCGTQLTTNCDLMDASRVGGDISPRWARVPWQVAAVAWRLPLNGHRFLADPDFTVMTSNCTVEPEGIPEGFRNPKPYTFNGFNGPIFSENEVKAWLSFIIISGGLVNLSDRLAYLKPYALELLEKVYKYAGGPGFLAIDAENTLPGIYTRPYKDKTLLAVFNWFDEDKDMTIPFGTSILPSPKKLKEIWSGEISDVTGDPITLRVPARSAFLYEF